MGAGRLLANELSAKLKDLLGNFLKEDKLIIGICNGFQVLVKSGILPSGKMGGRQEVTLAPNDSGKFEDRWVYLKSEKSVCVWTEGIPPLVEMPVAHGEGKFLPKGPAVVERLAGSGQVVFQYSDSKGEEAGYPWDPNGSADHITGLCDPSGRIFGLMPHPERHLFAAQHPRRTAEGRQGKGDGLRIFQNGVRWVERYL